MRMGNENNTMSQSSYLVIPGETVDPVRNRRYRLEGYADTPAYYPNRFYLASDLYQGRLGQLGILVVDRFPGSAMGKVLDTTPPVFQIEIPDLSDEAKKELGEDLTRKGHPEFFFRHKYGNSVLCAMRLYALPLELIGNLQEDEYLGPALIRRSCEKNLPLPNNAAKFVFDSYEVRPRVLIGKPFDVETTNIDVAFPLLRFINSIVEPFKGRKWNDYAYLPYRTYFENDPRVFSWLLDILLPCIPEVVNRFDGAVKG